MAKKQKPVDDQMQSGIDRFGWCRAVGHQWKATNGALTVQRGVVRVELRCGNDCGSVRVDHISMRTGELTVRDYHHASGYVLKIPKDAQRPRRDDWRKLHYKNLLGGGKG